MALGYAVDLRNARLDEIAARAGSGALLRIYDGTRPSTGGAATTLLAELVCGSPFAPAAAGGLLTANAISDEDSALASSTATWFRLVDAAEVHVLDGDVGTSGTDMVLSDVNIIAGGTVSITSFEITAGNA